MTHRWRIAPVLIPLLLGPGPAVSQAAPPAATEQAAPPAAASQATPAPAAPDAAPGAPVAAPAPAPAAAGLPHDLSPWSMFLNADIVVKAVMVGLLAASVATWTIWLAKTMQLFGAKRRALRGLRALAGADSLVAVTRSGGLGGGPVAALVAAAADEVSRSGALPSDGVKERAALSLGRIEARGARAMTQGTGVLATVGSVAPFVGLFGTVWGIMNSFVGISQAHTSNLAVVAPGIAEALLATAVGLVAAIPAVVIFNGFARATAGYKALLGDASAEVMRHLSRDLDRRPSLRQQAAE
ncbi:tonB-system energizer ExbB [Lichenibacterium minor]|uniref:Biopolymer transport protein ExbB n=1 Tax=Lichenibacterium minor TaxID=2316528 RepID=A0A4Q2UB63_9HYPH|nr:tonB-system energizer ExbB [Lichenibacterium minor]RYC34003.1 tonB-system energizer ExbB [Lichenibacterium minor]